MPVAVTTYDTVYRCPSCAWVILRTDTPGFVATPMRCPRVTCQAWCRLADVEVPDGGRRYQCRACQCVLFESPTPAGRVWVFCRNPSCRYGFRGVAQTILLGTTGTKPSPRIVGRADVVIGAPRL